MTVTHESSIPGVSSARGERERARAATVPHPAWGWVALLGAPLAWAVHIGARYPLVPVACEAGSIWPLQGVTIGCLLASAAALVVSIGLSRRCAAARRPPRALGDDEELAPRAPAQRALSRMEFLARAGVLTSAVFLGVIAAEGVPPFFQDPCTESLRP